MNHLEKYRVFNFNKIIQPRTAIIFKNKEEAQKVCLLMNKNKWKIRYTTTYWAGNSKNFQTDYAQHDTVWSWGDYDKLIYYFCDHEEPTYNKPLKDNYTILTYDDLFYGVSVDKVLSKKLKPLISIKNRAECDSFVGIDIDYSCIEGVKIVMEFKSVVNESKNKPNIISVKWFPEHKGYLSMFVCVDDIYIPFNHPKKQWVHVGDSKYWSSSYIKSIFSAYMEQEVDSLTQIELEFNNMITREFIYKKFAWDLKTYKAKVKFISEKEYIEIFQEYPYPRVIPYLGNIYNVHDITEDSIELSEGTFWDFHNFDITKTRYYSDYESREYERQQRIEDSWRTYDRLIREELKEEVFKSDWHMMSSGLNPGNKNDTESLIKRTRNCRIGGCD